MFSVSFNLMNFKELVWPVNTADHRLMHCSHMCFCICLSVCWFFCFLTMILKDLFMFRIGGMVNLNLNVIFSHNHFGLLARDVQFSA